MLKVLCCFYLFLYQFMTFYIVPLFFHIIQITILESSSFSFFLFFSSHLDLPLSLQIYFLVLFFPQILTAMVATIIHTLFCCVKYVSFGRDLHISNLYPCIINIIKYNHHNPLPQLTFSLFLKLPCHNCIAMSGTCSVVFTFS